LRGADGYAHLLKVLHSFHCAADPLLQAWVISSPAAPDLVIPSRCAALGEDLAVLGSPTAPPISLDALPRRGPDGVLADPGGLALLYVVAGSSIGARVVLAGLSTAIPQTARRGLSEGASEASTELWRRTRAATAHPVSPDDTLAAAAACRQVFALLLARAGG
jgi:heme oxygenase